MKTRAVKPIRHKTPYRHTEGTLYCYLNGMRHEFFEDKVHGVWWHRWQEWITIPRFETRLDYKGRPVRYHMQVRNFVKWRQEDKGPEQDVLSMCKPKMVAVCESGVKRGYSNIPRGEAFGPDTYEYLDPRVCREVVPDNPRNERLHHQH